MKIYLAGPMRGITLYNFPAFDAAAALLRRNGHEVFSPADHDREVYGATFEKRAATGAENETPEFDLRQALGADTAWICRHADAIAMLPGWEKSSGAFAEWALARALGLTIWYVPPQPSGDTP
ncbi:MAG: DUF4406 domain-containing protein [Phycisphaeraceae bacterium]